MDVYEGIITFNDVAPIQGKTTSRFFGYVKMKDTEGDENSYSLVSFRSQVINQSVALGKNGMQGKTAKIKGVFEMNSYNQQWQLKVEELFLVGMENLGAELNHAETPIPKKPSDVPLPTNPVAKLIEHIPENVCNTMVMPGVLPSIQDGYVYKQNTIVNTTPQNVHGQLPIVIDGGYVYKPDVFKVNNHLQPNVIYG